MPRLLVVGLSCWFACSTAFAQGPAQKSLVEIAPYKDDHVAALSFGFDDGLRDQFDLALPLLDKHGFHATFFIVPGRVVETDAEVNAKKPGEFGGVTWTKLKQVAAEGHEIASHSWMHQNMPKLDDAGLEFAVAHADQVLQEKIGTFPLTFCYPGNGTDDRVQTFVLKNHLADRNGGVDLPSPDGKPVKMLECRTYGYGGPKCTLETCNAQIDKLIKQRGFAVTMIHGILAGYEPFTDIKILSDHLDYVKTLEDKLWIDTFAHVAGYVRMRMASKVNITAQTDHSVTFTLTNDLPPLPPGVTYPPAPLTLRVKVPNATHATATRAGTQLPVVTQPTHLLVTAEVGPEPITVTWE